MSRGCPASQRGWDGTVWSDDEWIEQGVKWVTPSTGTSSPRYPSGGAVSVSEDRRPASLPTGVSDGTTPIALNEPAPMVLW